MGTLNLGLDDRSARLIHGRDVWTQIRGLLSGYSAISAAIAFVGPDADQHLPLRGPATIVVNAGDDALSSGWTDPEVLLRWTRRGVRVYSLASLHAKVLLADGHPSFVLIGSADVLSTSGRVLDEAVLLADERETVEELRNAIGGWRDRAGEVLTESWLQAAASKYRPAAPHRLPVAPAPDPAPQPAVPAVVDPRPPFGQDDQVTSHPEHAADVSLLTAEREMLAPHAPTAEASGATSEDARPADTRASARPPEGLQENAAAADRPPATVELAAVDWPRPKYIYLAALTREGQPSDSAQDRLDQLRSGCRVPEDRSQPATLDVAMWWWDEPAHASGKSSPTYREGWHVVPITVAGSRRPAVSSLVDSPGRVLSSYTDYSGGPGRTYYYLLRHCGGTSTTFRRLREALAAVGEKPSYNHAYMMQHKVSAILDLWPEIVYSQ